MGTSGDLLKPPSHFWLPLGAGISCYVEGNPQGACGLLCLSKGSSSHLKDGEELALGKLLRRGILSPRD